MDSLSQPRVGPLWALAALTLFGCGQDSPASTPSQSLPPDVANSVAIEDIIPSKSDVVATVADSAGSLAQDSFAADVAPADVASGDQDGTAIDVAGPGQLDAGGTSSTDVVADTVQVADAAQSVDTSNTDVVAAGPDTATPNCSCPPSQVWLLGACVPNGQLGCGPTCVVGQSVGCVADSMCATAQAAVSCSAAATMAACVPKVAMTFADGSLRLTPTLVNKGAKVTVTIQGGVFYIGALYWIVRIGEQVLEPANDATAACTLTTQWLAAKAGTFPVAVAYGAQGVPNIGWTLVGFVSVGSGQPGVQPGFSCDPANPCAQAPPYTCACSKGVCGCSKL